jgi:hypothetical protein
MRFTAQSCFVLVLVGTVGASAQAQEHGQFRWQRGQTLQYKVEQSTRAIDTSSEGKSELASHVEQVKNWQVLEVDAAGVATVQMSLSYLKMRQQLPTGDTLAFDSKNPEGSHPQLREQLRTLIGKPLVVLRVDGTGKVVEVKSAANGPTSRYESELPFVVTLPGKALQGGQVWKRAYRIVLDPPLGAGEKYAAEQTYQVKSMNAGQAVIAFATAVKEMPPNPADQLPLLQTQPRGEVTFDARRGVMTKAVVTSGGGVEGHLGEGSRYEFSSHYQEQLISP